MNSTTKVNPDLAVVSKRLAIRAIDRGTGERLNGMVDMLGGLPRADGESDDSVRDQAKMLLEVPPANEADADEGDAA